jgi:2-amino-4-hydroxy-6-hydroxymethyldihydropteridine diphosphokinase
VAIGSNLDQPPLRVAEAFDRLTGIDATRLESRSMLYATQPMGPQDQPAYVNAAAGLLTRCAARELLDALLGIERAMGRRRGERWGPRIIDLDLIWMIGEPLHEPGLELPHPGVSRRNFVLYPLADIAPTLETPGHGRVQDLLMQAGDAGLSAL